MTGLAVAGKSRRFVDGLNNEVLGGKRLTFGTGRREPLDAIVGERVTTGDEGIRGFLATSAKHIAPIRGSPAGVFAAVDTVVIKKLFVIGIFIHAMGCTRTRGAFVRKSDLFTSA